MTKSSFNPAGDRIIEPMIALAHCSRLQRIIVAGSKSVELMYELQNQGYARVASAANCGHPAGQYDVALIDWRRRTLKSLATTFDWLADFLRPAGRLVIWLDPQKPAVRQHLCSTLEERGFVVEAETVCDYGSAVSARRREAHPMARAA